MAIAYSSLVLRPRFQVHPTKPSAAVEFVYSDIQNVHRAGYDALLLQGTSYRTD